MKANLPNSLQHMRKEPVSKETEIFCMSSMWPEKEKGCEDRACPPPWLCCCCLPSLPPSQAGTDHSQLPCSVGMLILIWRSRRWAEFISVNFKDHGIPQKSNTCSHEEAENPGRTGVAHWSKLLRTRRFCHFSSQGWAGVKSSLRPCTVRCF